MSTQLDLHEALRRYSYDHAFFCTFNFQADFFEEYCLEQFNSLETNNGITIVMDGRELDRLVLGPPSRWPQKANVRYLLHPARPKGRFHPKLFLLASKTRGLLVVGSANLTRPGLTRNAELVRTFSFELGKLELALPLFQSAKGFLDAVATKWPSTEFSKRLEDLEADIPWLANSSSHPIPIRLLHNLNDPLLRQIAKGLESPVHQVSVVSPFFDEKPVLMDWLQENIKPKAVTIFTRNSAPTLTNDWFRHPAFKSKSSRILFSDWGEKDQPRQLHAKAIGISHGRSTRLVFGSANFTRAALLATPQNGNVEVVLALDDFSTSKFDIRELFDPSGLAKSEPLIPFKRAPEEQNADYSLGLVEASLDESNLRCVLDKAHDGRLEAVILFHDGGSAVVRLEGSGSERRVEIDDSTKLQADKNTTVVFLRAPPEFESNRVLLTNLKDIASGASNRKERRVRDAERSANQFATALRELLQLKETDPLKVFLTYCDIPLPGIARLRGVMREPLNPSEVQHHLRPLGANNLREYATLHDAVMGFCERHTARLSRHARRPSIDAAPGCMHIVRSIAGVITTQIERFLAGLEHVEVLSIDEWYDYRVKLDQLLKQWLRLLIVLHTEWLTALARTCKQKEIQEAVLPDLEPLKQLTGQFNDVRKRVLKERERFRVQIPKGSLVEPPLSPMNVLYPGTWDSWTNEMRTHQSALEAFGT